jgi:hypothetical protein
VRDLSLLAVLLAASLAGGCALIAGLHDYSLAGQGGGGSGGAGSGGAGGGQGGGP